MFRAEGHAPTGAIRSAGNDPQFPPLRFEELPSRHATVVVWKLEAGVVEHLDRGRHLERRPPLPQSHQIAFDPLRQTGIELHPGSPQRCRPDTGHHARLPGPEIEGDLPRRIGSERARVDAVEESGGGGSRVEKGSTPHRREIRDDDGRSRFPGHGPSHEGRRSVGNRLQPTLRERGEHSGEPMIEIVSLPKGERRIVNPLAVGSRDDLGEHPLAGDAGADGVDAGWRGGGGAAERGSSVSKYAWSNWRRDLGQLAMDVLGAEGLVEGADPETARLQRLWLESRADTIYAGTNEIQLNLIAERALGMPR